MLSHPHPLPSGWETESFPVLGLSGVSELPGPLLGGSREGTCALRRLLSQTEGLAPPCGVLAVPGWGNSGYNMGTEAAPALPGQVGASGPELWLHQCLFCARAGAATRSPGPAPRSGG